jgi:hypothetical protein
LFFPCPLFFVQFLEREQLFFSLSFLSLSCWTSQDQSLTHGNPLPMGITDPKRVPNTILKNVNHG